MAGGRESFVYSTVYNIRSRIWTILCISSHDRIYKSHLQKKKKNLKPVVEQSELDLYQVVDSFLYNNEDLI